MIVQKVEKKLKESEFAKGEWGWGWGVDSPHLSFLFFLLPAFPSPLDKRACSQATLKTA